MKRIVITIVIIIILSLVLSNCSSKEEYTRVRVIANSNNEIDLQEKEKVAYEVLLIICKNNYSTLNNDILQKISLELKEKLDEKTYNMLNISHTKVAFPAKFYNNKIIFSGEYETILIKIGKAQGHNWWCVLYPDFFGLSNQKMSSFSEVEYRSYIYDYIMSF